MSKQDFYTILGVDRTASADDLKKAYRKLAMQYHPDKNPGNAQAEHKFKEINEAYDTLKDDQKRKLYDQYGHAAFEGGGPRPGGAQGFGGFSDIFDDIFSQFGGGFSQRSQVDTQGANVRYDMDISLEEAFRGVKKTITVTVPAGCKSCKGTGSASSTGTQTCKTCQGHGAVRMQQGFFAVERTCPDCQGLGQTIKDPCRDCRGTGRANAKKTLEVDIPAGVEDGMRIRLSGEGEAGFRGGKSGDLYVFLTVEPHDLFARDGTTLMCAVPLTMATAALGGILEVPSIDGTRSSLTIPEGTQTGQRFRLKGKGMSAMRGTHRGDLIVQVSVETPVKLTKRQKELLEEFSQISKDTKTNPESDSFFSRVAKFFKDVGGES